jgi:hypothetical protein
MRDELPSGLVLPPGVRAEDVRIVISDDDPDSWKAPQVMTPRVAALRADLKVAGPALLAFYNTTKGRW